MISRITCYSYILVPWIKNKYNFKCKIT